MEQQTKTVLEAIAKLLAEMAEELAGQIETNSSLAPGAVGETRARAANLRKSALSIQALLSAIQ